VDAICQNKTGQAGKTDQRFKGGNDMYDILVQNGMIADGSGKPLFKCNIGISEDRIVWIGNDRERKAVRTIDASGLVVAPGFIDMHAHDDLDLIVNPDAKPKVLQGVTTEVIGQCGFGVAPYLPGHGAKWKDWLVTFFGNTGVEWKWQSFGEYLDFLDSSGSAINITALVTHGAIRANVMGLDNRRPSLGELEEMQRLLSQSIDEGAKGMSLGLVYLPGVYAYEDELTELHRVLAKKGALTVPHVRGLRETSVEAIEEAIRISKNSGASLHIAHLSTAGKNNWDKLYKIFDRIDQAKATGQDITFDQHTYTASSTSLTMILPSWVLEGGQDQMIAKFLDSNVRNQVINEVQQQKIANWDELLITGVTTDKNKYCTGKTVQEIASIRGTTPAKAIVDLMVEENAGLSLVVLNTYSLENVFFAVKRSDGMFGSDGIPVGEYPHPRLYGTFPRVLQTFVRENNTITLEEAVQKMTYAAACRLNIIDRGLIQEGYFADIAIFNPETIEDCATYWEPRQHPKGIQYVLVNGQVVVENGKHTGKLPGVVIR
jgi:N-acyl-D-amino-acid deacylase